MEVERNHRLLTLRLFTLVAELAGRIWAYIQTVDPAISGQGGSNPTFRLANVLDLGFCAFDQSG